MRSRQIRGPGTPIKYRDLCSFCLIQREQWSEPWLDQEGYGQVSIGRFRYSLFRFRNEHKQCYVTICCVKNGEHSAYCLRRYSTRVQRLRNDEIT